MVTQHKEPDLQPILTAFPSKQTDSKASRDPLRYSVFNVSLSYSNRVYCPDCALLLEIGSLLHLGLMLEARFADLTV